MMPSMQKDDISHLAGLARIKLTAAEEEQLAAELPKIVEYVSTVSEIAGSEADMTPTPGPVHNVWREDEVTNEPGSYTEDLLAEMPDREGQYLRVKRILSAD
jgi:aspartyl-tRNA(Asn)/glutamyl-tRNA(Gln) amidotransferase subunit C